MKLLMIILLLFSQPVLANDGDCEASLHPALSPEVVQALIKLHRALNDPTLSRIRRAMLAAQFQSLVKRLEAEQVPQDAVRSILLKSQENTSFADTPTTQAEPSLAGEMLAKAKEIIEWYKGIPFTSGPIILTDVFRHCVHQKKWEWVDFIMGSPDVFALAGTLAGVPVQPRLSIQRQTLDFNDPETGCSILFSIVDAGRAEVFAAVFPSLSEGDLNSWCIFKGRARSLLTAAIEKDDPVVADLLISTAKIDLNLKVNERETALIVAAKLGRLEMVKRLLLDNVPQGETFQSLKDKAFRSMTRLEQSARYSALNLGIGQRTHLRVDVNAFDSRGATALIAAVEVARELHRTDPVAHQRYFEIIEVLLSMPETNSRLRMAGRYQRWSALDLARQAGDEKLRDLLMQHWMLN